MTIPPPPSKDEENEDWLITYADAVTLLMAFFVLLVSFSKIDQELFDKVSSGLQSDLANKKATSQPYEALREKIEDITTDQDAQRVVQIGADGEGITLELDSNAFFKPGSAFLREEALPFLKSIHRELTAEAFKFFNVAVEGHTDNDPISTVQFPSNWELSTARASTVVRYFIGEGMESTRLKAAGYAETQPKVPNQDPVTQEPIPENKAKNRRVVIRINRAVVYTPIKIPEFRRKPKDNRSRLIR